MAPEFGGGALVARILCVSEDKQLLETRRMMLEGAGYEVIPALGFAEGMKHCEDGSHFDLLVLGHSMPPFAARVLVEAFRRACNAPIVALQSQDSDFVQGADAMISVQPEEVMSAIAKLVCQKRGLSESA